MRGRGFQPESGIERMHHVSVQEHDLVVLFEGEAVELGAYLRARRGATTRNGGIILGVDECRFFTSLVEVGRKKLECVT